jgi:hypothetical protein
MLADYYWTLKDVLRVKYKETIDFTFQATYVCLINVKGLQINLYLEQPMEIQLFATFF